MCSGGFGSDSAEYPVDGQESENSDTLAVALTADLPVPTAPLLLQRMSEGWPATELFALLGVLVSSGPNCTFHIFSEMSLGSSYLLQNYIHLYVNHLQ